MPYYYISGGATKLPIAQPLHFLLPHFSLFHPILFVPFIFSRHLGHLSCLHRGLRAIEREITHNNERNTAWTQEKYCNAHVGRDIWTTCRANGGLCWRSRKWLQFPQRTQMLRACTSALSSPSSLPSTSSKLGRPQYGFGQILLFWTNFTMLTKFHFFFFFFFIKYHNSIIFTLFVLCFALSWSTLNWVQDEGTLRFLHSQWH